MDIVAGMGDDIIVVVMLVVRVVVVVVVLFGLIVRVVEMRDAMMLL